MLTCGCLLAQSLPRRVELVPPGTILMIPMNNGDSHIAIANKTPPVRVG